MSDETHRAKGIRYTVWGRALSWLWAVLRPPRRLSRVSRDWPRAPHLPTETDVEQMGHYTWADPYPSTMLKWMPIYASQEPWLPMIDEAFPPGKSNALDERMLEALHDPNTVVWRADLAESVPPGPPLTYYPEELGMISSLDWRPGTIFAVDPARPDLGPAIMHTDDGTVRYEHPPTYSAEDFASMRERIRQLVEEREREHPEVYPPRSWAEINPDNRDA